jgi:DNA repair ATPase RecN
MSGRDHEPIAAFFPSIDRNLMRDLDRQLRSPAPVHEDPPQEVETPRASTSEILDAVEQAAASLTAMSARIQELEAAQFHLETTNNQLKAKLGELLHNQQSVEAVARADRERATRAEQIAAYHQSRAHALEQDLATALSDLKRIAEAITGTLGMSSAYTGD